MSCGAVRIVGKGGACLSVTTVPDAPYDRETSPCLVCKGQWGKYGVQISARPFQRRIKTLELPSKDRSQTELLALNVVPG